MGFASFRQKGGRGSFAILLHAALFLSALTCFAGAPQEKITLSLTNVSLEQVFREIQLQSSYKFVYTDESLKGTQSISVSVKNATLEEVLKICFANQPVEYEVEDKFIVVKKRKVVVEQRIGDSLLVKGRIVDEKGEGLPRVSVVDRDKLVSTSTDELGFFLLKGLPENGQIIISSIGYETQKIYPRGRRDLFIQLKKAVSLLDEQIVKGYYNTTRRYNTGTVTKITAEQIGSQPVTDPILALQGLVPGLLITQDNGLPGSRFTALIRGQNSIQNGTSPLYIIDGVPFLSDNESLTQLNGILANSPFNSIDPADIESIEVMKDADATSIYGSRGANGVILITTKKAKSELSQFSANFYQGWGTVTRILPMMNTAQYLEMRKEAFANDSIVPDNKNAPDLTSWDQNRYTDFKKLLIGGTAKMTNGQLHFSGGTRLTKFALSVGLNNQTTVFPGDFYDNRITSDLTVNHHSVDGKWEIQFNTGYSYEHNVLPAQDLTTFISLPPNTYPLTDSSGKYVWSQSGYSVGNPLATLLQVNDINTDRLTSSALISYHPIPALVLKANVGYNDIMLAENELGPISSQDPAYGPQGSFVKGNTAVRTWSIEPQAEYNLVVAKKLSVQTLLGGTWQENKNDMDLIEAFGYTSDQLLTSLSAAAAVYASSSNVEYRYEALYGRLGLNWSGKYLLNFTGRRDGSSRFGPGKQFANFGAIGAGWIFSEEPAIKNNITILSFGKLRGSFGVTGNDQIGNYKYLDTYSNTFFPYHGQPGFQPTGLFNPDYSWERNTKKELALELGFLKDRIYLTIDWYNNRSDNQIIRYSLPAQTGFDNVLRNFPGIVQNRGLEFSLNAEILNAKRFKWEAGFNISFNRNELVAFPGLANSSYAQSYVIGKPLNSFLGLQYRGVDPQTGIYQFTDVNKDGNIDNNDYGYIGTTDPEYFGGLTNTFHAGRLTLSILLEFRKQKGYDQVYKSGFANGVLTNSPVVVLDRWQKPGDIKPFERFTQSYSSPEANAAYNIASSDASLTDASFIRLKNISLSYLLPENMVRPLKMETWRWYIQAQNLLTLTRYRGNDPESQSTSSLPPLQIITVGTQITF